MIIDNMLYVFGQIKCVDAEVQAGSPQLFIWDIQNKMPFIFRNDPPQRS